MKIIRILLLSLVMIVACGQSVNAQRPYKTYPNDPLGVREYTLDNGLKVFMSVYKDAPRIQTYIAVRAGSKNDPSETTGLAHYLEHMLFKGSHRLGTQNWEQEKVLIQKIEDLFEAYRMFDDSATRATIYHKIDSLSYEASRIAIANEYDKAMTAIGSQGTNAFTSNDYTMYVENIPSNQLETWCEIEADRFQNLVLRLFHTELEAVYEEKNISLANDGRKTNETMMAALFPSHPYGQQTTLGTIEHLKNPSMRNIREYFATYYVPNNMCIALAGDFDPDQAIAIIEKHFSGMKPGNVPTLNFPTETPITEPVKKVVVGLDPENLTMAFRINAGNGSREAMIADVASSVLSNGKCGLIDINLNQKQRCMSAYAGTYTLNDYTAFMFGGRPLKGQSLDEVKALLIEQIEMLKQGNFDESILEAAVSNYKLSIMKRAESNNSRASQMAYAFVQHQNWGDVVNEINEVAKLTKADIIAFANRTFKTGADGNYVVIYKEKGTPLPITKVTKPAITPIETNRDMESPYLHDIKTRQASPIEPVFVDFKRDLTRQKTASGLEMLYVKNTENATFNLDYYFDFGYQADKVIDLAADLVPYLGTNTRSAEQLREELYRLACNMSVNVGSITTSVSISGLSENMEAAMLLVEDFFQNVQPNDEALQMLVNRIIKARSDGKTNQRQAFSALCNYGMYGDDSPTKDVLSEAELRAFTSQQLIEVLKKLFTYKHRVLYYGPESIESIKAKVDRIHKLSSKLNKVPANKERNLQPVSSNQVLFVDYDAKNTYVMEYFRSEKFNTKLIPVVGLYNEYFGGSMNAIVFQEMREKRSLAYSASSRFSYQSRKNGYFYNGANVITQNDKLIDALTAYEELFDDMPVAEANFKLAQDANMASLRTSRVTKRNIIFSFLNYERMGYKENINRMLFEAYPTMTLQDVVNFNHKYIKGHHKTYLILGKADDTDFDALSKFGKVHKLSLETIFGY